GRWGPSASGSASPPLGPAQRKPTPTPPPAPTTIVFPSLPPSVPWAPGRGGGIANETRIRQSDIHFSRLVWRLVAGLLGSRRRTLFFHAPQPIEPHTQQAEDDHGGHFVQEPPHALFLNHAMKPLARHLGAGYDGFLFQNGNHGHRQRIHDEQNAGDEQEKIERIAGFGLGHGYHSPASPSFASGRRDVGTSK